MRSPLDTSTLVLAAVAVVLTVVAYLKDPGLPLLGVKNGVSMLAFVLPRMVVALLLAGLMQVLVPEGFVSRHFGQGGGIRALLLATLQTPWRFRTKRHLWAYAGLAVVTRASAEYELDDRRAVRRRRRRPLTRGLNRNHNRVVKDVFKGAATAAAVRAGDLQTWYQGLLARGMREELARVTLARKLAALTLRLWKRGERYDPTKLTVPAQ